MERIGGASESRTHQHQQVLEYPTEDDGDRWSVVIRGRVVATFVTHDEATQHGRASGKKYQIEFQPANA